MNYTSETDGTDHLNVYSKGGTALGRWLSNFAYASIVTEDGPFASIEGYWYWLGTSSPKREQLRKLHGFAAKKFGRDIGAKDWQDTEEFKRKIKSAIQIKLETYPHMKASLVETKIPLAHYYIFGGRMVDVPEAEWILDILRGYCDCNK